MDQKIVNLKSTTFCGKKFTRNQLSEIQSTVKTFTALSRRELAHTICEHLRWVTPRGTDRIQTCLNVLEEMELLGIIQLPPKIEQKKRATQKEIQWTDQTNEAAPIVCTLEDLGPICLQIVTEKKQVDQWNEFVDRYHYLGYRRPIGSHLRYYIVDLRGRKLGCLLFSFATWSLTCRDQWIGWTEVQREKHLNLVVNNNRFLIFPWISVKNLASKALSQAVQKIGEDWEIHHGYYPVLLETFVDSTKYRGTCYKAANWQHIGKTSGNVNQKEVYIYPLKPDVKTLLTSEKKSSSKKAQPIKITKIAQDEQIGTWQKIIIIVTKIADEFDGKWQKRTRVISTLLLVLFIFRLVFSKNKQGYGTTITELWDQCRTMNIPLPQPMPVATSAFCVARTKLDEDIFKQLNTEIIRTYETETDREDHLFKQHRIFAVDGSRINLPRQLEAFSYQKPSNNAHYPQGLVSCLYQLKSKIPMDFELVSHNDERRVALSHFKALNKNDLVVYDRGYFSYCMLYHHYKQESQAIFRLKNKSYKVIDEFIASSDTDRLVMICPDSSRGKEILKEYPEIKFTPLSLRLIKYVVSGITYIIGTTLIDHERYPAEDFPDLYHARWGVEELYKISKVLVDVEDFHSQNERGVKQELFAHFVLITLSRIFANQADDVLMLNKKTKRPEKKFKVNFKNCLTTIARNLESLFLQVILIKETVVSIIHSVINCRQKERPGRSHERRSHKPIKKWQASKKKKNKQVTAAAV